MIERNRNFNPYAVSNETLNNSLAKAVDMRSGVDNRSATQRRSDDSKQEFLDSVPAWQERVRQQERDRNAAWNQGNINKYGADWNAREGEHRMDTARRRQQLVRDWNAYGKRLENQPLPAANINPNHNWRQHIQATQHPNAWQNDIVTKYKNIGQAGTKENEEFLKAYKEAKGTPQNSMAIADKVMARLAEEAASKANPLASTAPQKGISATSHDAEFLTGEKQLKTPEQTLNPAFGSKSWSLGNGLTVNAPKTGWNVYGNTPSVPAYDPTTGMASTNINAPANAVNLKEGLTVGQPGVLAGTNNTPPPTESVNLSDVVAADKAKTEEENKKIMAQRLAAADQKQRQGLTVNK